MSGRVVMIDGAIVAPEDAKVSVFDRGFLYGDAVFEVLRTYRSVPFALEEHLRRLRRSAERVAMALPVDEEVFRDELERALTGGGNKESYVRIMVTRGSGPLSLDPDTARQPLRLVFVEPVAPPPREAYAKGIAARTVRTRRAVDETIAVGAKVSNYLANLLAVHEAKASGAQEALVVDALGNVVEGASSNVFVVKHGRVGTPPKAPGSCLESRGLMCSPPRFGWESASTRSSSRPLISTRPTRCSLLRVFGSSCRSCGSTTVP